MFSTVNVGREYLHSKSSLWTVGVERERVSEFDKRDYMPLSTSRIPTCPLVPWRG
jgi:hypothetical protein